MYRQRCGISCSARLVSAVVIIVLLSWCRLWGLDPEKAVDRYLVDRWEISDGIPSNTVLYIAQTPDGYLWFAASTDLVRFDGIKFSTVRFINTAPGETGPGEKTVPDFLFVDKQGTLRVGSSAGLTSYLYRTRQFTTLTTADGLTKDRIRFIKDDMRGNLWISFFTGYLNRLSNGKFTAFDASHGLGGKRINTIIEDRGSNLLFGTREHGVFTYRDGKFFKYPIKGLGSAQIIDMYEDRKGDLWIGTINGLFRVTGGKTLKYTTHDGLSNNYITYITEDSERNLWVGTLKGLNRIKKRRDGTNGFESLLKPFTITCLFEDKEKSLWIGTYNWGIRRLKDGIFISYVPPEAHREEIFLSLFEDRHGDTWIGAFGGKLFRCRNGKFIESFEIPGLPGTGITSIADDAEGNLWLGTNGKGIFQKKGAAFVRFTTRQGLADNMVTSISRDSRDNLWFSTFDGVSVLRHDMPVIRSFKSTDGLAGKRAHNIYEDKNHNILVAADKGITVLAGGKIAKENIKYYLRDISVTCIHEDRGTGVYWAGTHGAGLKRLQNGTVISYTTAAGMTTNFIYQFLEDQRGNFWLMSDNGILRIDKKELTAFADGGIDKINCTSFGISDGLKSPEFNNELSRNSALKTGNGEFRFITKKGITMVNPGKIPFNKSLPPVVIEAVFFDGQSIPLYPGANADADSNVFKGIVDFRFHFTAPTFISPAKVRFKYRLRGADRDWLTLPPGSQRMARYRDLDPGTYTFKVIACNNEGVWNRTGASITFTLKPFFYDTLLFKIALLVLFSALTAAAFYLYKKRPFGKKTKQRSAHLNHLFAEECIKKLRHLMEVEKAYCDENISLQSLAEKLSITPHVLSQVLNEKLNRGFPDFINFYRIEEAKRILQSPRGARQKIAVVAFEVGFNTMVAFYNAFKRYTGMTPAQYKKKAAARK